MPRPNQKTPDTKRIIALCYLRKSIVRNGTDYAAIDTQRAAVVAECQWRGWTPEWYEDADGHRSGRHEHTRPQWLRLKQRVASDDVVAIVGYRLDRIARSVKDLSGLMELCARHGVGIVTADKQVDTTGRMSAWSEAHIGIMAVFAQLESDMARDRMQDRIAAKDQIGINHGRPPFGMKRTGEGNQARFVASVNAPAVQRCLELYAGGMSYDDVEAKLNTEGVPFRQRKTLSPRWGRESVRTVVGNVLRYVGYHIPQTGYDAKANRVELAGEGDHCDRWAASMGAWMSPAVDAIISRQLANAVIERRHKNQGTGRPANNRPFLLTPIVFWSGKKLRGESRPFGRFYMTYGAGLQIRADDAEERLLARIGALVFTPEIREGVRQALMVRVSDERVAGVRQQLEDAQVAQRTLVDLLLSKQIAREVYDERYATLHKQIVAAERELAMPADVDTALRQLSDMGAMIAAMTPERQKRAVHHLFERIEITADGEIVAANYKPWARYLWSELRGIANDVNNAEGGSLLPDMRCELPPGILWFVELPTMTLV